MVSKIKLILSLLLVISVIVFIGITVNIVQVFNKERDPNTIIKSVVQLELNKSSIIEINNTEYITKGDNKYLKQFMNKNGYKFEEQFGTGLSFINNDNNRVMLISRKIFSGHFYIWESLEGKIPVDIKNNS
jgi:hypothetical protein